MNEEINKIRELLDKIPGRRSDLSIRMRQVFFICSSITFSIATSPVTIMDRRKPSITFSITTLYDILPSKEGYCERNIKAYTRL